MLALVTGVWLLAIVAGLAAASKPEVLLRAGLVVGSRRKGVDEFLGIPFARPPVGSRRWLPPEPALPWSPKTLYATKVARGCLRPDTWYTLNPMMSEDCLYLNLWAPPLAHDRGPAPVMVWIYGGGYFTGSGDDRQTRGDQMVKTFGDIVVVTFNYRLGVLGFLGSESMRRYTYEKTGDNTTGNMGFLDQVMLLRWVRENVAAFGGDSDNVMLFGESAGAGSISVHLTSPRSHGLFHKAAMHSGGFNQWVAMTLHHAADNFYAMAKSMRNLCKYYRRSGWSRKFRCAKGKSDVNCLVESRIPGRYLVRIGAEIEFIYTRKSSDWDGMQTSQWAPTVDGVVLFDHPFHLLSKKHWNPVPVLLGMNKDEGTQFMDGCRDGNSATGYPTCKMNYHLYNRLWKYFKDAKKVNDPKCFEEPLYKTWLRLNWGASNVDKLYTLYQASPKSNYKTNYWAAQHLVGDFIMSCTQRRAVKLMARQAPVFQYYFVRTPNQEPFGAPPHGPLTEGFGACHGCEIPFVFNRNDSKEYGISGQGELALGLAMSSYWTNFAWSGDPNRKNGRWSAEVFIPERWPSDASGAGPLQFNASESAADVKVLPSDRRGANCVAFWDPYFQKSGWFTRGAISTSRWWLRPRWPAEQRPEGAEAEARWPVCSRTDAWDGMHVLD